MNKKLLYILLPLFSVSALVGCTPATSSEPSSEQPSSEIPSSEQPSSSEEEPSSSEEPSSEVPSLTPEEIKEEAIDSLKTRSHELTIEELYVLDYPGQKYYVGLHQEHTRNLGYYVSDENKAFGIETFSVFADIDCASGQIKENTIRNRHNPYVLYQKNLTDGTVETESLTIQNTVIADTYVEFDESINDYAPVAYDDFVTNPFEHVDATNFTYNEDNTLTLTDVATANLILKAYGALSNFKEGDTATLQLDELHRITSIEFEIVDVEEGNRVLKNEVSVTYTNLDIETYPHVRPLTNDNPALAEALIKYQDETNFTYTKTMYVNDEEVRHLEGYYTPETIIYHNGYVTDETLYINGDNYDLKCQYNPINDCYDVYQYLYVSEDVYVWEIVMATESRVYSIPTFDELGPRHDLINASVFEDIGNNQYKADELVTAFIGQYFDYEVWGVDTADLESQCSSVIVTLNEDNTINNVEVIAILEGNEYKYVYTYENVGTTEIPEGWIEG